VAGTDCPFQPLKLRKIIFREIFGIDAILCKKIITKNFAIGKSLAIIPSLFFRPVQWCFETMCQGRNTAAQLKALCAAGIWRRVLSYNLFIRLLK